MLLLVCSITYSQVTMKATSITVGTRANSYSEVVFGETEYDINIPVHVTKDDVVHIYSKEDQVYYKTSLTKKGDNGDLTWTAIDQDGDRCTMYLMTVDGQSYLLIEFANIAWYYGLENY